MKYLFIIFILYAWYITMQQYITATCELIP